MIDQCISLVFQRDKKVFIPEFGAIIYSEFNDNVDFNELLTFDDGKVIEEVQKQQSISEEEARKALEKYVKKIKSTVEKGKSHHIAGIGHLTKDDQGSLMIQKEKSSIDESKKPKKSAPVVSEEIVNEDKKEEIQVDEVNKDTEDQDLEFQDSTDFTEEETAPEFPRFEKTPIFPVEENDNDETIFSVEEEDKFVYEDELEINETETERGRGLKIAFLIIIPIVLIAAGVYYYLNYYKAEKVKDNTNQVESIPKNSVLDSTEKTTEVSKSKQSSNVSATTVSNAQTDQIDEDKTFCLIMGSFKVESNADKYQRRLKQKGLNPNKFKGRKNFYFVGIESIKGKSNAVKQLTEIKSKVPSAWIYNKDLLL
jgi:nucleoid DNA-binding protein